jgi:hypothetical protein
MGALIAAFRTHKVDKMDSAATRRGYTYFLDRLDAMAGDRRVDALTRRDIYALEVRDLQFFIMSPTGKKCSANYINELWNDGRARRPGRFAR